MGRFLFKKISVWLLGLILVLCFGGTIIFGAIVKNVADGFEKYGAIGKAAFALASVPGDLRQILNGSDDYWMAVEEPARFPGHEGWEFTETSGPSGPGGYLLLSRYDGDIDRAVIELVNLDARRTVNQVVIQTDDLFRDVEFDRTNKIATPWIPERFRAVEPVVFENGDLLIKDHGGPLARISSCNELSWILDQEDFHHSLEPGVDGSFWVPTHRQMDPPSPFAEGFRNMGLAQVSADGEFIYERSLGDLLIKAGLGYLIYSVDEYFEPNPMHLNDIQPVLEDGPYWKRGDVFFSLRNLSTLMLFRPSTDEIVWWHRGPWQGQHDVDIINDHTISVFNNDTVNLGKNPHVRGSNKVSFYDFDTGNVDSPYDNAMAQNELRTILGGLFELLPNGYFMIEETGAGRLAIMDQDGAAFAQYYNRASDGKLYHLGWSRYLGKEFGDHISKVWQQAECT